MVRSKKTPPKLSNLSQSVRAHQQAEESLRGELQHAAGPEQPGGSPTGDAVGEAPASARLIDGAHRLVLEQPHFAYPPNSGSAGPAGARQPIPAQPAPEPLVAMVVGSAKAPLHLPQQPAALSAHLGAKAFVALQVLLAKQCDVRLASSLFRGDSAVDARTAADYLFGQIVAARPSLRGRDPVAHETLFCWVAQLFEAGYAAPKAIVEYFGVKPGRLLSTDLAVTKVADAELLRLIAEKGRLLHPLVGVLAATKLPERPEPVVSEHLFAPCRSLLATADTKHLPAEMVASVEACTDVLRSWLLRDLEGQPKSIQAHAHQVYLHVASQEERADWLEAWLPASRALLDDPSVFEGMLTSAILNGSFASTRVFLNAGVDPQARYECKISTHGGDDVVRMRTLASLGVLHQAVTSPLDTPAKRQLLADSLVEAGASPMSLAKLDGGAGQAEGVTDAVNTVIHALQAGDQNFAQHLLHLQQNAQAARTDALVRSFEEAQRGLNEVRLAGGARGEEHAVSFFTDLRIFLSELTHNYGFGLESTAEANVVQDLLALGAWSLDVGQTRLPGKESVPTLASAGSTGAVDVERAARLMGVPADDAGKWPRLPAFVLRVDAYLAATCRSLRSPATPEPDRAQGELAGAIDAISAFGGPLRCLSVGPLTALSKGLAHQLLHGYLKLPVRVLPQDLVQAFVWLHASAANSSEKQLAQQAQARQQVGKSLLAAATRPEALLALLHAAVRLAQPKLVQLLLRQDRANGVSFTSCTGPSQDKLAFLVTESTPSALPALLKGCANKTVRSSWLAYRDENGDTALHVAARTSLQALKTLLDNAADDGAPLSVSNAFGVTAFQEAVSLAQTQTVLFLLETYPRTCFPQLRFEEIGLLPPEALFTVLRAVAKFTDADTWHKTVLQPLIDRLRRHDPATANAASAILRETFARTPSTSQRTDANGEAASAAKRPSQREPATAPGRPVAPTPERQGFLRAPELQKMWATTSAAQRTGLIDEFLRASAVGNGGPAAGAPSSVTTRAWALLEALHATSRGTGIGRHYVAHRPDTPLAALRDRASNLHLAGASRFGANDALALLHLRRRAEELMDKVAAERLACFVVELASPDLRGDGVLYDAATDGVVYYKDSQVVRFVMRWGNESGSVDFVSVYPVPDRGRRSLGQLRRV